MYLQPSRRTASLRAQAVLEAVTAVLYRYAYCTGRPVPFGDVESNTVAAYSAPWQKRLLHALAEEVSARPLTRTRLFGFYLVESAPPLPRAAPVLRVYWNVPAPAAPRLIRQLLRLATPLGLPFAIKTPDAPDGFDRTDAMVLYVAQPAWARWLEAIRARYDVLGLELRPAVPLFTRQLADGLAIADEPLDGSSFGLSQCRQVAEACLAVADARGRVDRKRLIGILAGRGEERSSAGATGPGHSPLVVRRRTRERPPDVQAALVRLGRSIVGHALWLEDRCTFLHRDERGFMRPMGAGLYEGTSGVALFLAAAAAGTRDSRLRKAAMGAIRHALFTAETLREPSYFEGWCGVALAAQHVGRLLEIPELHERSLSLFRRAAGQLDRLLEVGRWDIAYGAAGVVMALASVDAALAGRAREAVQRCVGRLRTWIPTRRTAGLAHGVVGLSRALSAWGQRGQAGGQALSPELSRRMEGEQRLMKARSLKWCRGAAGLLVRPPPGPGHGRDDTAFETVLAAFTSSLRLPLPALSLCHGLSGAAFCLERADAGAASEALAAYTHRLCREQLGERMVTCSPALFTGASGVGWFLASRVLPLPLDVLCG